MLYTHLRLILSLKHFFLKEGAALKKTFLGFSIVFFFAIMGHFFA
jgi:hypothetical protein